MIKTLEAMGPNNVLTRECLELIETRMSGMKSSCRHSVFGWMKGIVSSVDLSASRVFRFDY